MITDIIVYLSCGFTVVFVAAWVLRPDLRARIERPKYLFLENVQRYDRSDDCPTIPTPRLRLDRRRGGVIGGRRHGDCRHVARALPATAPGA